KITVNPSWEYHKEKQKERLSTPEIQKIYGRRKIDVETVFGFMKACLGFTRYTVRGLEKVRKQTGLLITAINMMKLTKIGT
ncbi:Transposase DDE domain-containing protein, partial [Enterococcus casseliflavus]